MEGRGFLYVLTGGGSSVQIVVSIHSLRDAGHTEPILIVCGDDEGVEYANKICGDERLGPVRYKRIAFDVPDGKGKGRQHCAKASMGKWTEFDETIFLDADTLVSGRLDRLWPLHPEELVLTKFAGWKTTGGKMRKRLATYRERLPDKVAMMLATPYPAINTGVVSWGWNTRGFHNHWQDVCLNPLMNGSLPFMGDEITANLIFPDYPHRIESDLYNFSPIYSVESRGGECPEGVKVWHFHGKKHVHKGLARSVWLPKYEECIENDLAGITKWTPARDRRLRKFLEGTLD